MNNKSTPASSYLGEKGPFWQSIDGYQVRQGQQALCDAIDKVLENRSVLTAEAGTGIGKTFAYLIPAILSDKKNNHFDRHATPAGSVVPQRYTESRRCAGKTG